MENPFRSEAAAYRFLLLTVGYFGTIAIAAVINRWAGLAVFVVMTAIGLWIYLRRGEPQAEVRRTTPRRGAADERRILVIANETVGGKPLLEEISKHTEGMREQVLVVTPALNSPIRHWMSDEDPARAKAHERLERSLARLREAGIDAKGEVGDSDPLQAIEDALRTFGADEVIISTHPEGRSNWLERGVVSAARDRFDLPITHVVVDLAAEPEEAR